MIAAAHIPVVTFAINTFGSGEHPVASARNIEFFQLSYIRQCLECVIASDNVTEAGKDAAHAALEDLS